MGAKGIEYMQKVIWTFGCVALFIGFYFLIAQQDKRTDSVISPVSNGLVGSAQGQTRYTDLSNRIVASLPDDLDIKRLGVFITYGQSNSANSGELGYHVRGAVYQFYNQNMYEYVDPALGGTGIGGSVWGITGDELIDAGAYDFVVFIMAGRGDASLSELSGGTLYDYFRTQYKQAIATFGKVDGILLHQGERHNKNHERYLDSDYYAAFEVFLDALKLDEIHAPIYLAQTSYCRSRGMDHTLLGNQNKLIRDKAGVLRGPNTDLLIDPKFRQSDQCHFSLLGMKEHAARWRVHIMNNSEQ